MPFVLDTSFVSLQQQKLPFRPPRLHRHLQRASRTAGSSRARVDAVLRVTFTRSGCPVSPSGGGPRVFAEDHRRRSAFVAVLIQSQRSFGGIEGQFHVGLDGWLILHRICIFVNLPVRGAERRHAGRLVRVNRHDVTGQGEDPLGDPSGPLDIPRSPQRRGDCLEVVRGPRCHPRLSVVPPPVHRDRRSGAPEPQAGPSLPVTGRHRTERLIVTRECRLMASELPTRMTLPKTRREQCRGIDAGEQTQDRYTSTFTAGRWSSQGELIGRNQRTGLFAGSPAVQPPCEVAA